MRKISQPPSLNGLTDQLQKLFNTIFQASQDADLVDIAQAFTLSGTFTETRTLNVSSPTLANLSAVFATFLLDCQRGGQNRTT